MSLQGGGDSCAKLAGINNAPLNILVCYKREYKEEKHEKSEPEENLVSEYKAFDFDVFHRRLRGPSGRAGNKLLSRE